MSADARSGHVAGTRPGTASSPGAAPLPLSRYVPYRLAPFAVAFFLGAWQISARSFSQDEAATLAASSRPLTALFRMLAHIDAVHGAYYLLIHVLIGASGPSETVVRLPSVCATAIAAAVLSALCARACGPRLGLTAGLLFAAAPPVTASAQAARPFAMATCLVVICYYWFFRLAESGSRRHAALLSAALMLSGLCDVLTMLIAAAAGVTVLSLPRYRARIGLFLVSAAVPALLLGPLAVIELGQAGQVAWETPPPLAAAIGLVLLSAAATIALARPQAGYRSWQEAPLIALAVPWLLIPPAMIGATAQITPMWENWYLLFCVPALAVLAAVAIARIPRISWRAGAAAAILAASLAGQALIRPVGAPDDLRAVGSLIAADSRPGDAVVFPPEPSQLGRRLILAAYPADFRNIRDIGYDTSPDYRDTLYGRNVPPAILDRRLTSITRFWLIEFPTPDPPQRYGAAAAPYPFCAAGSWQLPGSTVTLYTRCPHQGGMRPPG